ncbi:MAG: aldo/keto reductase [Candidatus Humimicrobiia bacterium]
MDVSVIGLGAEYLFYQDKNTVVSVINKAIDNGINYIDIVFNITNFLDNISAGIKGKREKIILTGHLGSGEKNGKYYKTYKVKQCEEIFNKLLSKLNIDYIDIVNLHNVRNENQYKKVISSGGLLDFALQLKEEGLARFISISTHDISVAKKVARSGKIDVIMIQVNLANNAMVGRNEMLATCARKAIGLVAMKVFAGGKLLQRNRTVNIAAWRTGGMRLKKKISPSITPIKCISYTLSQVGVCTVVPGVKNVDELNDAIDYLNATDEEKDFSELLTDFNEYITGECVYCNHCLPCPSDIDIGQMIRLFEVAKQELTKEIQNEYNKLPAKASDCNECGVCIERCPFEVDVISKMKQIRKLFELNNQI